MPITYWPLEDRPREKLLTKGVQTLTDAELIAILLQSGTRGKTALDIAKELLREHGSLKQILSAHQHILMKKCGIGQARYAILKAAIELGKRYQREDIKIGAILNNSYLTQSFLSDRMREYKNEVFVCLFLDSHFRLIHSEEVFQGTINEVNIYPRELVRRSLAYNAANIILAHNHPSGQAEPSIADQEATKLVKQALALVDVHLIDHIIIGYPSNFSFAESGLI